MNNIERKNNSCKLCGKPSGTWTKCVVCRAKIYAERSRKKREAKGITPEGDEKFYREIWNHNLHFCAECGSEIQKFSWDNFHHILKKERYPEFRYEEFNIIILCGRYGCHGKAESAISYPKMKVYEYCEQIKKHFLKDQYESKITTP